MPNHFWGAIPLLELKKGLFKLKKSSKGFAKNLTSIADLLYGTNLNQLKLVAKEKRCTECQTRGIFKQKGFEVRIIGFIWPVLIFSVHQTMTKFYLHKIIIPANRQVIIRFAGIIWVLPSI